MTDPEPLDALRTSLDTFDTVSLDIPEPFFAQARKHLDAMERTLAEGSAAVATLAATRRTIESLVISTADDRRRLQELTSRRGYTMLDGLAGKLARRPPRTPVTSPEPEPTSRLQASAPDPAPPSALAVAEWRELLQVAAERCGDDERLNEVIDRARAELDRVTPLLPVAETTRRDADRVSERLRRHEAESAEAEAMLAAVRARLNSRILDVLHVPAGAPPSEPPLIAEEPEEPPEDRWPESPAGLDVADSPVVARLEQPQRDAVTYQGEPLLVTGWAFTAPLPVSKVEAFVDGRRAGSARLGYARREIYVQYGDPHALLCGFEFFCDPAAFGDGDRVTVEIYAETMHGRRSLIASRRVWVARRIQSPTAAVAVTPGRTAETFNVLVVTHDLGLGGGQLWLLELLDRMGAGRDFPCTVVSPQSGPLAATLRRLGVEVHVNGRMPTDTSDAYEGRMAELVSWAMPRGFSAVLVNTFLAFPGADLAERLGLGCAWAIHESWQPAVFWSVAYPPGGIARGVKRSAARALANCHTVVFEAAATRALYDDSMTPGAAAVVRYGIRTQAIRDYCAATDQEAARKQVGITGFSRILLVMGTVEPRKWQTVVALAFQQVAAEHPDTALVFVGAGDTPYVRGLTEYLGLIGLNHQVRVEPLVADTYPWYRAADALVCASDIESMPRSILEAMAFGLPICAANVFGLPELLTDGETGLLFEGGQVRAIVEALRRLLTMNPPQLDALAQAGKQHVFDSYDSIGYATRITEVLHTLSDVAPASTR